MINKLLQYGFSIQKQSENGITWLKKSVETEPTVEIEDKGVFYWDGKSKIKGEIKASPLNTDFGQFYGNPNDISEGLFFIKDFESGKYVKSNFNPFYAPLVVFRENGKEVFCPSHKKWEKYSGNEKTVCKFHLQGIPVKLGRTSYKNPYYSFTYGFQIIVNPNQSPFIVINYFCINPNFNENKSYLIQRCIGLNSEGQTDWLSIVPEKFLEADKILPDEIYDVIIRIISTNIKNLYGVKIENKNFKENQDFISAIYSYPFDYNFYFLKDLVPEVEQIDKTNPKCFELLCQKIGFNSWRTFRRKYNENYKYFIVVRNAIKMGFKDKNILNKILNSDVGRQIFAKGLFRIEDTICHSDDDFDDDFELVDDFVVIDNEFPVIEDGLANLNENIEENEAEQRIEHFNIINRQLRETINENLTFEESPIFKFYKFILQKKGEISAWNLIEKNMIPYIQAYRTRDIFDVAYMFFENHQYLSDEEKQKIVKEGFTLYNHNLLVNVMNNHQNALIDEKYKKGFEYTKKEKSLEGTFNGFEFKLPEKPSKLLELGQTLHNCVGGYIERVFKKSCLIVYATKDNKNRLCIEVRGNLIQQGRADHNSSPKGEALIAFNEWKNYNKLLFEGNHF